MRSILLAVLALALAAPLLAAQIESKTTRNGVPESWSVTSVGPGGVLRIDEGGFSSTASGGGLTFAKGAIRDTMIFDPEAGEIMSVEGSVCRVLSSSSAPPPGMEFMDSAEMQAHQEEMARAMAGANEQIAEAMKQMRESGASQAELDMMENMMEGFQVPGGRPEDNRLEIVAEDRGVSVGEFEADVYLAKSPAGVEKFRFYMTDVDDIPGGEAIKDGVVGMMNTMADVMKSMGVGQIMDDGMMTVINGPEFKGKYPVAVDDLQAGTRSEVTSASGRKADVDFSPDCEKRDMMGN